MKVIRVIDDSLYNIVEYPAVWGNLIQGLADNIKYYEIRDNKPSYNPIFQKITPSYIPTDEKGELLNICNIEYTVETLDVSIVEIKLNDKVGQHLDSLFPEWERSKHSGKSLRAAEKLITGEALTEAEETYLAYIKETANWCRDCRLLRDAMQQEFELYGTIMSTDFPNRPEKNY